MTNSEYEEADPQRRGRHFPFARFKALVLAQGDAVAHKIVTTLDKWGITPFAQSYRDYDGGEPTQKQKDFARWVNNKAVFHTCAWKDYKAGNSERREA